MSVTIQQLASISMHIHAITSVGSCTVNTVMQGIFGVIKFRGSPKMS